MEEDAESLLDAYASAASAWMKAGDPVRAYRFLTQIVPLAATWGHVETFTLLSVVERRVSPPDRVRSQWDDALGWLKSSVLRLHRQAARRASSPASE